MPTIDVQAKDFGRAIRQHLAADTALVRSAALNAVAKGERDAVRLTDENGLVDRGIYKASWKHAPIPNGAELRNDSPIAGIIEWGRRPNRPGPPFAPIYEWVKRKLVPNGSVEEHDAYGVAKAIRDAIHRRGLPPHFILRRTFRQMRTMFRREVRTRLRQGH